MRRGSSGAAAVEFALIVPILVVLLLGTIEFGYLLFLNGSAAGAAREGAREMAITGSKTNAEAVAIDYFKSATGHTPVASASPATCSPEAVAVVTVTYADNSLTGFFDDLPLPQVSGIGEMRCGG